MAKEMLAYKYKFYKEEITIMKNKTGKIIADTKAMITSKVAEEIVAAGYAKVKVRSPLSCKAKHGVCSKCYGMSLAIREEASIRRCSRNYCSTINW